MVDQPMSMANKPSSTAPITVGNSMMRPAASQAARPEPTAMEMEKIARHAVTTSSLPPNAPFTSGGISESATAPTSQNQLVTRAPHHRRGSSRRKLSSPTVEGARCAARRKSGAPAPVGGMSRLAPQHRSENTIIRTRNGRDRRRPWRQCPPTMVPSRMAMKVAPSTSALPAGSSERARWSGQDAVLDRTKQRSDDAEQKQYEEQERHRMQAEAQHRDEGDSDLGKFEPLGDRRLVVAVGELARRAPRGRRRAR